MKKILLYLIVLAISGCSKAIVLEQLSESEDNILNYGIRPGNNFYVDQSVSPFLKLEWQESTYGSFTSTSFIAYDSLLIVPDLGGRITALSIHSGKERGQLKNSGGIEQTAIIDKNRLFFVVNDEKEIYSTLIVYDLLKGNEIASKRLNGRFDTEIIKANNSVYAVSSSGILYSISPFGDINWKTELNSQVYSNIAADEKYVYLVSFNGNLFMVDAEKGDIQKSFDLHTKFDSGISHDSQNLYVGDETGSLLAIEKSSGSILWKYKTHYGIKATPSFDEYNVYVGNLGGEIISVSKKDGSLNWDINSGGLINTSPLIMRNLIFQSNQQQKLDILDKQRGEIINSEKYNSRCRTTPIFYKDKLFLGIDKGEVLCYSFQEEE